MADKKQKKFVALYVRKSRLKDPDALEIDRQIELLIDYANANNMEYTVFSEEGSSEDWNRPEFQRMLSELKKNLYDGILVTDQDRLTRDRTDFGLLARFMKSESLQLFTLNKTYNFMNDEDAFMSGIQSEMDQHLMRMTKRKLRRGRIQAIKKGVYFGIAPYGYTKDERKHLKPLESEAEIVREIYELYTSQGLNQAEIVERINNRGYKTREGNIWTVRKTSLILQNVAYIGVVHYELEGEEPIHVEDAHPSLVDRKTFDKAQEVRASRRKTPQKSRRGVYNLSKLLVCPKCGQTLSFCMKYVNRSSRAKLDKDGRELYVLNCHASKGQKAKLIAKDNNEPRCENNGVKSSRIEEKLFEELGKHLSVIDEHIERLVTGVEDYLNNVSKTRNQLEQRLGELDKQKKKVQQGYIMEIFTEEESAQQIKEINYQQAAIQRELDSLKGADVSDEVERQKEIRRKIETLLSSESIEPEKTNKLLREVVDKVYYWKGEIDSRHVEKPFEIQVIYK